MQIIQNNKKKLIGILIAILVAIEIIVAPYIVKGTQIVNDWITPEPIVFQAEDDAETKAIKEIMKREQFQEDVMHYAVWVRSMELEQQHRELSEKYGAIGTVEWGRLQTSMQEQLDNLTASTTLK